MIRTMNSFPILCTHLFNSKLCFTLNVKRFLTKTMPQSFHKRPLPQNLVALSSSAGKKYFREALSEGGMECFFPLAEQFVTQSEPSYCSLSTLAMVLNALNYDPKKVWKGAWRWVSEDMLHCETQAVCGHSLEKVQKHGLSFSEFESLARCHGVNIISRRACHSLKEECGKEGLEEFELLVDRISSTDQAKTFLVTNFSRKSLGQTGDGHYSPIGGYHRSRRLVLILDVARFKYPPYWVRIEDLWESMAAIDQATGLTRGYFIVSTWKEQQIPTAKEEKEEANVTCPPLIRTWEMTHKTRASSANCSDDDSLNQHHHTHHEGHCNSYCQPKERRT